MSPIENLKEIEIGPQQNRHEPKKQSFWSIFRQKSRSCFNIAEAYRKANEIEVREFREVRKREEAGWKKRRSLQYIRC